MMKSSFRLVSTRSAASHAHNTQPANDTHRAKALAKLQQAKELKANAAETTAGSKEKASSKEGAGRRACVPVCVVAARAMR